jgi:hypothetical protein
MESTRLRADRLAIFVLALGFLPAAALAAVPSPPLCTVDRAIVGDSSGDAIASTNGCGPRQPGFNVVVRDVNNLPIPNSQVVLDFSNAPGIKLCISQNPTFFTNCAARTIIGTTNVAGVVRFAPSFGHFVNGNAVGVYADGVLLATVPARSTDVDGFGGTVGLTDYAIFSANFAAQAPTPETNFDDCSQGNIGTALQDFVIFSTQFARSVTRLYCP